MKNRKWLIIGLLGMIEIALCIGIVGVSWFSLSVIRANSWVMGREQVSVSATEEQTYPMSGAATLSVDNTFGKVTITGGPSQQIAVKAIKTAYHNTEAEAQQFLSQIKINTTQIGNQVTIEVVPPSGFLQNTLVSVEFIINVPTDTAVRVDSEQGEIILAGVAGGAQLSTSFGDVEADDITGTLSIDTKSGQVTARHIHAAAQVIEISSDFGSIRLEDALATAITLRSKSGELHLTQVVATETVVGETDFGGVLLENVKSPVYQMTTKSGAIEIRAVSGRMTAQTDFGDVTITEASEVTLELSTKNGAITFAGTLGSGPHTIATDFGNIRLTLPQSVAFDFDFTTDFGKIKSEFPMTINGTPDQEHWQGMINQGGALVTASTKSGNISLEIAH